MPLPVLLLGLGWLRESILSGLVLSVGGLTEAVVKSSSGALLDLCRSAKKVLGKNKDGKGVGSNNELLAGIGWGLVRMVEEETEERVCWLQRSRRRSGL